MEVAGQPTIRVMEYGGELFALEGSHRLCAAHLAGIEPKLVVEIPEVDFPIDRQKIIDKLPIYDFEHAHVLWLRRF